MFYKEDTESSVLRIVDNHLPTTWHHNPEEYNPNFKFDLMFSRLCCLSAAWSTNFDIE
jgi:hypothetical protein